MSVNRRSGRIVEPIPAQLVRISFCGIGVTPRRLAVRCEERPRHMGCIARKRETELPMRRPLSSPLRRPEPFERLVLSTASLLVFACGHSRADGPVKEPPEAPTSVDSIPVAPLEGKLGGEPFTFKSGRYTVDQRPGYEKIDIKLYDVSSESRCGAIPGKPASVWLRRRGPARVAPETARIDAKKGGEWEVHYQRFDDERWMGKGEANALLGIDDVGPDMKIDGELSACFRDSAGSCVRGHFSAVYCQIHIDAPVRGTDVMERPPSKPLKEVPSAGPGVLSPVPVGSGESAPSGSAEPEP